MRSGRLGSAPNTLPNASLKGCCSVDHYIPQHDVVGSGSVRTCRILLQLVTRGEVRQSGQASRAAKHIQVKPLKLHLHACSQKWEFNRVSVIGSSCLSGNQTMLQRLSTADRAAS